jgi:hypothetical protein
VVLGFLDSTDSHEDLAARFVRMLII